MKCNDQYSVGQGATCDPNSNVCTCVSGYYADAAMYRCVKSKCPVQNETESETSP